MEIILFNAYGVKDLFKDPQKLKTDNIVNYINDYDQIAVHNGKNHIGEVYSVPRIVSNGNYHSLESLDKLTNRKVRNLDDMTKWQIERMLDDLI